MRRFGMLMIQRIRQQLRDKDKERTQQAANEVHIQEHVRTYVPFAPPKERRKRA